MSQNTQTSISCLITAIMIGFGLIQIIAGWIGIEETFGWFWGIVAVIAAIFFRFTIPIVIGAFLCAKNIWDWHWILALLFAVPGLLYMVPAFFSAMKNDR